MSLVKIAVPAIQGALFTEKSDRSIKVYGKDSTVIMTGSISATDKKEGDKYVPMAYGRLNLQAAKAQTREGKEYMFLLVDGGLQGRLMKAEGKDYDYIGSIDAGEDEEFVVFGRKRKSEGGLSFISINSAERKKKEATPAKTAGAPAHAAQEDEMDIPF